jgi:2'-5' RNA ligase
MKATFALLANTEVHNMVRKLSWDIHMKYRTGTLLTRLQPHISLKQPFSISDLAALGDYMAVLAGDLSPFEVTLTEIQQGSTVFEGVETGILWLDVQETAVLRDLHNRLNRELEQQFGGTQAVHDGPDYHFHMTVMMFGQPIEVYRQIYAQIEPKRLDLTFQVRKLAMFVYDEPMGPQGDFLTYKILPLG